MNFSLDEGWPTSRHEPVNASLVPRAEYTETGWLMLRQMADAKERGLGSGEILLVRP